jgi:glycosyltransferase involved in cell wall biosynthesis
MIEAFGCGVPVICSRLGAMQEIVTDWRSGPHFAPGDADDLANAFYKLASDPELRARLSLGAIKRVEEHFNWDKKGLIVAKLYESLSAAKEGMAVEPKLSA